MANPGEEFKSFSWDGIYRAKVIDSKDPNYQGRVKIWIPDLMPEIEDNKGLWARPANNPLGGRNSLENTTDHYYQGSCLIPPVGSYIYIFFEYGNPNEPRYLSGGDFGQTKVPIENQQGSDYEKKWTIYKSKQGRLILISDDSHDERIEITGKKRLLNGNDPSGNQESVYAVNDNQTVILIDERSGNEKILIKDYKGNYINLNTETGDLNIEVSGNVHLEAGKSIYLSANEDVHINAGKKIKTKSVENTDIKSEGLNLESISDVNMKSATNTNVTGGSNINIKATNNIHEDGLLLLQQQGAAASANSASDAVPASPNGDRNDPDLTTNDADELPPDQPSLPITKNNTKPPDIV